MIRSLTIGLPIGRRSQSNIHNDVTRLFEVANRNLCNAQTPPRTIRYTLPPVGEAGETEGYILSLLRWVDDLANKTGVRWFCLPIDFIEESSRHVRLNDVLDAIIRFPKLFVNLMVADQYNMSIPAIYDASALITKIARKSNNGFDNFRIGASCGCYSNTPFFPFSHHKGESIGFSFALETTEIAWSLLKEVGTRVAIDEYRELLVKRLSTLFADIHQIGEKIARDAEVEYRGLDASFAPFPGEETSVAILVERLLGAPIGSHGSMFITGILTDTIRAALLKSGALPVGFNGVMYSLLEDKALASANNRRNISLDSLVAMSSMCGCGVDMVPIPGVSFPEEIAAVILDIAAMALSLKKPLGVRLLPIPGRTTNEFTEFNLDFLCDSRVMGLTANDHIIPTKSHVFKILSPLHPVK